MDQRIEHSYLPIRGLKLHIAHIGKGLNLTSFLLTSASLCFFLLFFRKNAAQLLDLVIPGEAATLLFVHGFPEVWYSWRHQMIAAAAAGFRAIALDFPGYGLSEPPADLTQASWQGLMNDLLAILDSLSITKVSTGRRKH